MLPGHAVAIALEAEVTVLVDLPRLGPGEVVGPERGDRHEAFAREPVDGPLARRGVDAHVGHVLEPVAHGAVPLGRTLAASEVGIDQRAPRGTRSVRSTPPFWSVPAANGGTAGDANPVVAEKVQEAGAERPASSTVSPAPQHDRLRVVEEERLGHAAEVLEALHEPISSSWTTMRLVE